MLLETMGRVANIPGVHDIWVSTQWEYASLTETMLKPFPNTMVISEPFPKSTAPCIGLAAVHVRKKYGDAIMLIIPADHLILDTARFRQLVGQALQLALEERIVTFGIRPDRPETGYGYIELGAILDAGIKVKRYVEKPNLSTASEYVRSGSYLWNSGTFVFKASRILTEIGQHIPKVSDGLCRIAEHIGLPSYEQVLKETFTGFPSISIDYGVMEKAENMVVLPADIGWDDVGSWLSVERLRGSDAAGNSFTGQVVAHETHRVTVDSDGKRLIALAGVDDLVVVDCDDVLMICTKEAVKDIRTLVAKIRAEVGDRYI